MDAPVSGGVEGAKNGTLAMMVGGSTKALEKVRPVIEVIAKRIIHMGRQVLGRLLKQSIKLCVQGLIKPLQKHLPLVRL